MARLLGFSFNFSDLNEEQLEQRKSLAFLGLDNKDHYIFFAKTCLNRAACAEIFQALSNFTRINSEMVELSAKIRPSKRSRRTNERVEQLQRTQLAYLEAQQALRESIAAFDGITIDEWDIQDLSGD
jgi:hypothetical protein